MSSIGRTLAVAALGLATLGFGGAGLCGAVFTLTSLPALFTSPKGGDGGSYATAFLVISVPSLVIGVFMCRWCWRMARRVHENGEGG